MTTSMTVPAPLTLRELVDERLTLDEFLIEHDGEFTPEIEALLRDVESATAEKVEAIAWFVKQEKTRMDGIAAMLAQLQQRKQAIANRCEWLTNHYLREQLTRLGKGPGDPLKGTLTTVRFQYNNPKLDGEIPAERLTDLYIDPASQPYVRYTPEQFALDKVPLLAALKAARATAEAGPNAQAVLDDPTATVKDRLAATRMLASLQPEEVARAQAFVDRFPELSIVRDLSVRIA